MPDIARDTVLHHVSASNAYARFFEMMEDVGFFEHIYEHLPDGFTALFEVARILDDPEHALTRKLQPALSMQTVPVKRESRAENAWETYLPTGEEYEAQLLKSYQDVPHIYTYQWLLPEEIFLRRVAERSLWVPYAKEPTFLPIASDPEDYNPDSRKQKVYILLDTSSSMGTKNRIHLAKAIVYHFLKHNLRELGYISLRTFDVKIGELHQARDRESFHALISYVMRLHTLGNGTAMARAIEQAVADIRELPQFAGTEILIVTDGACTLDEARMRELMGEDIRIHTVKIGRMQMFASRTFIEDAIAKGDTPKKRSLIQLRASERDLRRELQNTARPTHRHTQESSMQFIQAEIRRLETEIANDIYGEFGHEIERLSTIFITVDDLDSGAVYAVDPERMDELEALFEKIGDELREEFSLENLKKAALLNEHIAFLLKFAKDQQLKQALTALERRIENLLKSSVQEHLHAIDSSLMASFSAEDRHDVQFLLEHSIHANISLWKILLWKLIARMHKVMGRS